MNQYELMARLLDEDRMRTKEAFSTNAFSGPMNPVIQSGASFQPPMTVPGLQAPVQKKKIAASAPTRGNFMMASDLPPMKVPSLRTGIEKGSDMLPEYIPYMGEQFEKAKLTKKSSAEFAELAAKLADVSPTQPMENFNGGAQSRAASFQPGFRQPSLAAPLRKLGGLSPAASAAQAKTVGAPKVTAPAGPSIAEIAKPKGHGFGTGIAGAFKGGIGGTAPVGIK